MKSPFLWKGLEFFIGTGPARVRARVVEVNHLHEIPGTVLPVSSVLIEVQDANGNWVRTFCDASNIQNVQNVFYRMLVGLYKTLAFCKSKSIMNIPAKKEVL